MVRSGVWGNPGGGEGGEAECERWGRARNARQKSSWRQWMIKYWLCALSGSICHFWVNLVSIWVNFWGVTSPVISLLYHFPHGLQLVLCVPDSGSSCRIYLGPRVNISQYPGCCVDGGMFLATTSLPSHFPHTFLWPFISSGYCYFIYQADKSS